MGGATTVPHCNIIFVLRSYVNVTLQPVLSWLFSSKAGTPLGGHGILYIVRTFIETTSTTLRQCYNTDVCCVRLDQSHALWFVGTFPLTLINCTILLLIFWATNIVQWSSLIAWKTCTHVKQWDCIVCRLHNSMYVMVNKFMWSNLLGWTSNMSHYLHLNSIILLT